MNSIKKKRFRLSVIVINYNTKDLLKRCLEVLFTEKLPEKWNVVVVDNDSRDGSASMVRGSYNTVSLIEMGANEGFSKAANMGIKSYPSDFYMILNSDTEVRQRDLKALINFLESNDDIGVMSPFQVDSAEIPQLCWGAFPTFFSDLKRKRLQKKLDKFNVSAIRKMNRIRNKGNCFSVGWVSGSTMLLRDAAIGEAGLFDDKIFMFFEDIDICTRVRRAGWRVVVDPMVVVIHHRGESAKKDRFNSSMHYRRSHLYFWQKYHSSSSVFLLKVYLFIKFSYRILNLNIKYYFKKIDRNYLIEEKKLAKGLRRIIFH